MTIKAVVVTFPGTNCDEDTVKACERVGFDVEKIWHTSTTLPECDIVFLPGGFSYGDYVSAGRIAKFSPIIARIKDIIEKKSALVVGICNGFQILCEIGALQGALLVNQNDKFYNANEQIIFENKELTLPVAHIEGRFWANEEQLSFINEKNMAFLKYKNNFNGSIENIAGLYDTDNRVIGLMPHPERAAFEELNLCDGIEFFEFLKREVNNAK